MRAPLIDLLRGGVAALVAAMVVIRIVCRRPTLRRLSFALWQAERDDAINRAAVSENEGPGADRASQLLSRMRRFFGLMGGELGARG